MQKQVLRGRTFLNLIDIIDKEQRLLSAVKRGDSLERIAIEFSIFLLNYYAPLLLLESHSSIARDAWGFNAFGLIRPAHRAGPLASPLESEMALISVAHVFRPAIVIRHGVAHITQLRWVSHVTITIWVAFTYVAMLEFDSVAIFWEIAYALN